MSQSLPSNLPGREHDDALGLAGLDAVRKRIADDLESTQGAWRRQPAWRRFAPLTAAALAGFAFATWGLVRGAAAPGAWLALLASGLALGSLAAAPTTPSRAERIAMVALVLGVVALIVEALTKAAAVALPGSDLKCASVIGAGALLPIALVVLHLKLARTPARALHVVGVIGAGMLASMAAVWAECSATELAHVLRSHLAAPIAVAVVLFFIVRPLLRGARLR